MIETYLLDQHYYIDENKNMIFTNDVAQIGIIDFENSSKYFGCISSAGKNGEYNREGCGCFVSEKERFFGNYSLSERYGTGMSINKDGFSLGCYYFNKKNGVFFERNQGSLTLCWYDKDKKQDYYIIDNKTFDVKQYDKNGRFLKKYSFNEPSKEKVELTKEDKINPKNLETLKRLKLKYMIDSDGGIIVNGINESPNKVLNIFIPGFVKGVAAHSFENCTKLTHVEIENGVLFLGENAFFGCTNIETINLSNKITEINAYTFSSKKLTKIVIPNSVSLVKDYSFIKCPNIKYVEFKNPNCVVEDHAFAEKAEYFNGRNFEREQKNRELFKKEIRRNR